VNILAAASGGAIGGVARLPLELLVGTDIALEDAFASVLTETGWFAIAALFTNIVSRLARNEHEMRRALGEAINRQTEMRTQMLNADLQTRRELAEWLHGPIQAELLLAAEDARRIGPMGEPVATRLRHLNDDELRSFAHSLHPTLAELNLYGALQELAHRYRAGTAVTVSADEATIRQVLPPGVAVAAYRTCEEAILNAVKHGGARQVHVTLSQERVAGHLTLTIANDGSGRPESLEPGLGLTLIDTYVRSVDGVWDLAFGAPSGAMLTATIPLVSRVAGGDQPRDADPGQ
jgi:two-component system NarL family sensor kinase